MHHYQGLMTLTYNTFLDEEKDMKDRKYDEMKM
jgi:hypothetical protein